MKKIITLFIILHLAFQGDAQIQYSGNIPKKDLAILKNLEKTLKQTNFTKSKIIDDSLALKKDSVKYGRIMREFFDTLQIASFLNTNFRQSGGNTNAVKGMTTVCLAGMQNMLHCLPGSLFFVMPATEYCAMTGEGEKGMIIPKDLLFAGYRTGGYLFPAYSFQFNKENTKLLYLNPIIYYDTYSKEKEVYFKTKLRAIIAPCARTYSENYGKNLNDPAPGFHQNIPITTDTATVIQ